MNLNNTYYDFILNEKIQQKKEIIFNYTNN